MRVAGAVAFNTNDVAELGHERDVAPCHPVVDSLAQARQCAAVVARLGLGEVLAIFDVCGR